MKKFFGVLLSDSNKFSTKRFIGLLCLTMFIAYGIVGLVNPFNLQFWIFYVSLCNITMWIAFRFMSAEKVLKYDVISKLTKLGNIQGAVEEFKQTEATVDSQIQPDANVTQPVEQLPEN